MTSRDFCFWLQGFLEVSDCKEVSEEQLKLVKQHLGLVFQHDIKMPAHAEVASLGGGEPRRRLIC